MAHIMVVDDEDFTRSVMRKTLEIAGHTVSEATNGHECIKAIETVTPDIVIIDIFMPVMDGYEAVPILRKTWPDIKIVSISGGGGSKKDLFYLDIMKDFGSLHTLTKPIKASELLAVVHTLMVH